LGIPVFAYTNVAGNLIERTRQVLRPEAVKRPSGEFEDSFHMLIEDFDCIDNLMLVGAVEASGPTIVVESIPEDHRFSDLSGFEECLKLAAHHVDIRNRVHRACR
jgi:nucleoside 2-deoxyribosyltransferase